MFKYLTQKWKQKRGFTLMEVMVVVAILAVIAGIAIPSVINMRKNMKFTERNDYAKAIFMAAQANLTEMRSKGELSLIIPEDGSAKAVKAQADETPPPSTYIYTWNSEASIFDCVLPANSIDSAVRNGQIIIEYNPAAGIVYSVFYYDDDDMDLKAQYASGALTRDEEGRKELLLGYYSVGNIDALDAQALDVYQLTSSISFTNSDKALLTISVPSQTTDRTGAIVNIFEKVQGGTSGYTQRMEIALTISGENTNSFTVIGKSALVDATLGETGVVSYTTKTGNSVGAVPIVDFIFTLDSLNENENFKKIIDAASGGTANTTGFQFGDNTAITADITFYPSANDPIVMIESSTIAGINPMFHSLTQNPDTTEGAKPYILAISNARHLKNLEYFAKNHEVDSADTFIKQIDSIVFVEKQTLPANNGGGVSGNTGGSEGGNGSNSSEGNTEGASIQPLTTSDTNTNNGSGSTGTTPPETDPTTGEIAIDWDAEAGATAKFTPIDFSRLSYVPNIIGNGVKISNLRIAESGNPGSPAGLFAKLVNASIDGITLVDPNITNASAFLTGDLTGNIDKVATTGALAGTAVDTTITNCNVIHSENYTAKEDDAFAIEGRQFVGGLVGYTAGNTTIKNCSVTVEVADTGIVSGETDNITYQLGGLVGYADGTTFENCTTTATVTATTATDLGGMAGKAVNASFTGCSTEATVTGADGVLSNIGGLVGYAEDTLFTNPDSNAVVKPTVASGMNVFSSDNTKNHVGGMVGYAKGSAKDKTKFTNYSVSERATVLSNVNSCSDIGGMVGYADTVTFSNCNSNASVNGSQKVNSEGTPISDIPNNNLGGFIGYSKNSTFNNIDVTLNYLPTYAMDAGVFAGYVSGSEINDLELYLSPKATDATTHTVHRFGVVSSTLDRSSLTQAKIEITGNIINANCVAGAAFIADQSPITNVSVEMKSGRMIGNQTAGFVGINGSSSTITNCSVLADVTYTSNYNGGTSNEAVTPGVAGFVLQNSARIRTSIANVVLPGGSAFAAANNGTIKDCYGWVWRSSSDAAAIDLKITKNCSYSYFVNGSTDEMVMYEGLVKDSDSSTAASVSGESDNIKDTAALADPWALELLNAGTISGADSAWSKGSDGYDYPELSIGHVGKDKDPVVNGEYDYSIVYTEKYDNSEGTYTISSKKDTPIDDLDDSETITSTSYVIYCRSGQLDNISSAFTEETYNGTNDIPHLYSRYTQEPGKHFTGTIKINGHEIELNTYCAPGGRIRTGEQFANISKATGSDFTIERSITLSSSYSAFDYSGEMSAASGVTIDASAISGNLVGTLKGTLSGLTVTGLKAPMVNEISGGTVTGCDVSGKIESGENVGIIAGTMSSGSIENCKVSGSVSGSGYVGGVIGKVTGGSVSDVNSSATVNGDVATSGMFVGYASGGEFTNCKSTATTDKLPFGKFATEKLSNATHFASTTVADKLYEENFTNNFTAVTDVPESVTIKVENCTFNNGLPALISGDVYYYKVNTTERQFQLGTTCSLDMDNADGKYATYNDMLALCDEVTEGTPVKTNYFILNISNYNRLSVSVTSKTVKISTDSTTEEGGTISKEQTQYTFTFTNTSTPAYSFTKELLDDELSRQITSDINGLYVIAKDSDPSACSIKGSQYLIHGGDYGYLTYDPVEGTKWGGAATSENSLWKGSGNGDWWNFMKDDVSVTITATDFNLDSFGGLAKVEFNGTEVPPFDCPSFSVTYVAFYYEYEFLGTAKVVNYPNS